MKDSELRSESIESLAYKKRALRLPSRPRKYDILFLEVIDVITLIILIIAIIKLGKPLARVFNAGLAVAEEVLSETAEKLEKQKRG